MFELERQVLFTHQPLRHHFHFFAESGRRKALAPHLFVQRVHHVNAEVFRRQRAVGGQAARQGRGIQPFMGHLLQRLFKGVKVLFGHRATGRHRVAAKAQQHARVALGHQVQRVTQMKAGDRPARALELMLFARRATGRKHKGRPVQLVFDARGHDAHHAFMKVRVKNRHGRRRLFVFVNHGVGGQLGLLAHVGFDGAPLAVDAIQRAGEFFATSGVVGQQAFNAQRHV